MDSVSYLVSKGYSNLQIECIKYTLLSREDELEHVLFDGVEHRCMSCRNKGITKSYPDRNPCKTAKEYCAVMKSIAIKARRDKEPTLGYWYASKEEQKDFKEMRYPSRNWEEWWVEVELANGLI